MSGILNLLGIVTQGLDDLVGIACSPFVVGQDCTSAPVCCEENGIVSPEMIESTLSAAD